MNLHDLIPLCTTITPQKTRAIISPDGGVAASRMSWDSSCDNPASLQHYCDPPIKRRRNCHLGWYDRPLSWASPPKRDADPPESQNNQARNGDITATILQHKYAPITHPPCLTTHASHKYVVHRTTHIDHRRRHSRKSALVIPRQGTLAPSLHPKLHLNNLRSLP